MKKKLLIILVILFLPYTILSQNILDEQHKLFVTAKVWGYLKYYHPLVAKGQFDWDKQLLDILPSVEKAKTKEELSTIYIGWIESLGEIKKCKSCNATHDQKYFNKNFDLEWTKNNMLFTPSLIQKFKLIEENRFQGKPYYVTTKGRRPDLVITHEKRYNEFDWANRGLRLLSLFRYWNIIEYYYPHKYQIDTDWDIVLSQMIPGFSSPDTELDYHLSMLELVVKLDDSHGYFITDLTHKFFGLKQIPASFKIIDSKVLITGIYNDSLAILSDIQIGDIITKIEDVEISEILEQNFKYIYGSNYDAKLKYAFNKILHGNTDSVKVEIIRGEQSKIRKLVRYASGEINYHSKKQKAWRRINYKIGYINLGAIEEKELVETLSKLTTTKAIILDLRNYPKKNYGYILRNHFGTKNTIVAKQIKPDLKYPGKFILSDQIASLNPVEAIYQGQVILLVDERTQSRAEYTAMWIQNGDNVTTIGSRTAGAGGLMINQEFVGGYKSYFTSSGIFYPDMTPIQRKGVKVDYEVKPTIEGLINGQDEVLEKAIEIVNE